MKDRVRSRSKLLHNDLTAEQNRWRRVWDSAKRLEWQSEYVLVTHSLLKQQSSYDMTRTTRQFPPSSSGVLQTRHMGLIRSPTDTKRNDVLGCCFFCSFCHGNKTPFCNRKHWFCEGSIIFGSPKTCVDTPWFICQNYHRSWKTENVFIYLFILNQKAVGSSLLR